MKQKIFLLINFIIGINLNAQNEIDALRYSQDNIFGTAKFNSMSGSFGSLGGDFSVLSNNPAGIALYQNSEFSITPGLNYIESKSNLQGNINFSQQYGSLISNLGVILVGDIIDDKWQRVNIGFGWNQTASYNNSIYLNRNNENSSLADLFLEEADGLTIDNLNSFGTSLAFWTDIIDLENNLVDTSTNWYAFDNGNYISHVNPLSQKRQFENINSYGDKGEFVISIGSSYEDNIYFGATIGFPLIYYSETSTYTENNFIDTTYNLREFNYTQNLTANGSGINLKFGSILRINHKTKIGVSINTPSYITMEEDYSTRINTLWSNGERISEESPLGYFTYDIITPWKISSSASTVINDKFLINAEIEQIDYSFTHFISNNYSFIDENNIISSLYKKATNIKFGGELNLHPFKLRGGYAILESPFNDQNINNSENYSAGLGIDFGLSFFDVSYTINRSYSSYTMYSPENEASANIRNEVHYLLFTLGVRY